MATFLTLCVYFIPTFLAMARKHNNIWPILIINLFTGWTFVGWVVALAMSLTNNIKK